MILKKNLIVNLSTVKKVLKTKIKLYGDDKGKILMIKKCLKWALIILDTCLTVITIDSALKEDKNY